MLRALALLFGIATGVALGLATTAFSLSGDPPFGAVRSGVWTAWPAAGTASADPYLRALFASDGRIPLAAAAGLRFVARIDDAGQPLVGLCSYEIAGPTPDAQDWTVTVLDPDGYPRVSADPRSSFTSTEVVRSSDGGFTIVLARQARPGNWLPTGGNGPFLLMLSVYDTPLVTALTSGGPMPTLPSIAPGRCS